MVNGCQSNMHILFQIEWKSVLIIDGWMQVEDKRPWSRKEY